MWAKQTTRGFTIVELLIVIVVIAMLAVIVLVAYNGVEDKAKSSKAAYSLTQAAKKVRLWQAENLSQAPATLADAGINDTADLSYQYSADTTVSPATFCITATTANMSYYLTSTSSSAQSGICPGHNLIVWNESQATMPVPSATYDTTTYRSATASMRLGPGATGRAIIGNPYTGTAGDVYKVTMWVQTDATWNGTAGNSKIRFGNSQDGALLTACGYAGAKATWTQVTCTYTLSTVTSVSITVGNDGTTGNIWIDDLSVSRT
jgi:prepilin-type N-terminal cleavage/methylation domain-containing protein